ncbi:MAG TPA: DNA polymerase I, partial [Rhodospirillaceae bacterium]|nr:DNA polymerase I [Rhodospirillaceae bacterium]
MKADKKETLYLIDGSGYIFRAFHALPPMTRRDGTPVNAVYGFCNMLQKLLGELQAQRIAVIFDAARKTFRNDIYPDYKAHRPPPPEELIPQFPLIRDATRAFGVPALEVPNYEADDVIAAYARLGVEAGWQVRVVSADKDLMQLVSDQVELFDPMKAKIMGIAEVEAKFGVLPEKVVDVQALAGDSADNVPGVPGIGVKTAAQLILEYGSLEDLLARASEIKQPKRRQNLIDHADLARLSKKLVFLDDHAPIPMPLEEIFAEEDHQESLATFLAGQGFKSLLSRMGMKMETKDAESISVSPKTEVSKNYELIQDVEALRRWIKEARDQGYVALDTETTSLLPSHTKLVGVSLAVSAGRACYIPLGHVDPDAAVQEGGLAFEPVKAPKQIKPSVFADEIRALLRDPSVIKIAHNLKFDAQVLASVGVGVGLEITPYDDTMLLSYVLSAGLHGYGLDELALRYFEHKMVSFDEVAGKGKNRITFDYVPLDKACDYAAEDADYTLRLWLELKPLLAQKNLSRVYERIERPLVPVIAAMETVGIKLDPVLLKKQGNLIATRLQKLEEEVHSLAGRSFNLASPKQLGEILFNEMGLSGGKKGKTGAYSTSVSVLEPLAEQGHEIVSKLLDWRGLAKLKSTYIDALPEQINAESGRIHTSFSMVGAATGRLSSTDPNLQNIPIRTEEGRAIRRAFIAEEGHLLLSVDYSQIEMRLAAAMAGIEALIQAFHDGGDIHAITASEVFGIPLAEMTPEKRRQAKAINFGIIYGISGFGLAKQIGTGPSEAGQYIKDYLEKFHELRDWMEDTKEFAREHGYVET